MKKAGIIFLVLVSGIFSVAYYYWKQATKLPEWYTDSQTLDQKGTTTQTTGDKSNSDEQLEITIPEEALARRTGASTQGNGVDSGSVEVNLDGQELNELLVAKISKGIADGKLSPAVKASNTTIKNGKIESGAVVSLSEIPVDQLEPGKKAAFEKAVKAFPPLKHNKVYVGIEGRPKAQNGQLAFDDNTNIKLGNLTFTVVELSDKLGVSKESVQNTINLDLSNLKANDLD